MTREPQWYEAWRGPRATIHSLFTECVQRNPDRIAIESQRGVLTYQELDRDSNRLAACMAALGVGPGSTVGVFLDKSTGYILTCLAASKLGAATLHIESAFEPAFVSEVVAEARPALIVTDAARADILPPVCDVLQLDRDDEWLTTPADGVPVVRVDPDHVAIVGYTSGTTGRPKGVAISHRAVIYAFCRFWGELREIGDCDRFGYVTYMTWDSMSPLVFGATGVLIPDEVASDVFRLVGFLQEYRVNHAFFTPTLLKHLLDKVPQRTIEIALSMLRVIWLGGEIVTQDLVDRTHDILPQAHMFNNYGPTECFVVSQGPLPPSGGNVRHDGATQVCAAGRVLPEITLKILDHTGSPTPPGEAGLLFVSGPCLAIGYMGLSELTRQRFRPIDGQLFYETGDLGRLLTDGQLQVLGRAGFLAADWAAARVLERALRRCTLVSDCVVLQGVADDDVSLVAFVVVDGRCAGDIATALEGDLPKASLVLIDEIPIHPVSRKVDYRRLLQMVGAL